jgi:hypothetical protein
MSHAASQEIVEFQLLIDQLKESVACQEKALAKAGLCCSSPSAFQNALCLLRNELERIRDDYRQYENTLWRLVDASEDLPRASVLKLRGIVKECLNEIDLLYWDLPHTPRVRP